MMNIAVAVSRKDYPPNSEFSPGEIFPEYTFADKGKGTNFHYGKVRECLRVLGFDRRHFGTAEWNPLSELIRPGQTVVIKPNFVLGRNNNPQFPVQCSITHGSIIRPLVDYAYKALGGKGHVIICDAPQHDAVWDDIMSSTGVPHVREFYEHQVRSPEFKLSVLDLRPEFVEYGHHVIWKRRQLTGDPLGYVDVDLGSKSEMTFGDARSLYGADYNRQAIIKAHSNGRHIYNISRTVLSADTFISVPKLKVHKKCGVTINLKLLVGINGVKNLIPHYRVPTRWDDGDCFPDASRLDRFDRKMHDYLLGGDRWPLGKYVFRFGWAATTRRVTRKLFPSTDQLFANGNWHGNDTVWRSAIDLMKVLLYADKTGSIRETRQRGYLSLVDGIIGGEGEGPLAPSPRPAGLLLAGTNGASVDVAAARLMGFDPLKIKLLRNSYLVEHLSVTEGDIESIRLISDDEGVMKAYQEGRPYVRFEPHPGWKGYIELSP